MRILLSDYAALGKIQTALAYVTWSLAELHFLAELARKSSYLKGLSQLSLRTPPDYAVLCSAFFGSGRFRDQRK